MSTDGFFGGAPSLSWKDPAWRGRIRGGLVVAEPKIAPITDFKTKKVVTWDDGSPKRQMIVELRCDGQLVPGTQMKAHDERDPTNPRDDGVRRLYIKSHMVKAVGAALREANETGIRVGGMLFVAWTSEKETEGDLSNAKLFTAKWFAPAVGLPASGPSQGDVWGQEQQAAPQQPQQAAPAQSAAPADPWSQAPAQGQQAATPNANPFG